MVLPKNTIIVKTISENIIFALSFPAHYHFQPHVFNRRSIKSGSTFSQPTLVSMPLLKATWSCLFIVRLKNRINVGFSKKFPSMFPSTLRVWISPSGSSMPALEKVSFAFLITRTYLFSSSSSPLFTNCVSTSSPFSAFITLVFFFP